MRAQSDITELNRTELNWNVSSLARTVQGERTDSLVYFTSVQFISFALCAP